MIRKNLSLRTKPFLLKPVGKECIWGGSRLNDDFSKNINIEKLGETWECSTHPDGQSIVASGEFEGMLLGDVLKANPHFLGTHPRTEGELPIMIKFIDAKEDLSVQVHPDDEYAMKYENGSLGKSEMWYVLDAKKDSKLVYGFRCDIKMDTLKKSLTDGTVEKYLQKVDVKKDDLFYIDSGTVHAIGKGVLIAEIQECSNITYRLFDYNRTDKYGNKRELHIDKALDVANLKGSSEPRQPLRIIKYRKGCATELLCRCKYFQVERHIINTEQRCPLPRFDTDYNSFNVLLCTKGCGSLLINNGETINFFKGDCIFVPANSENLKIHGKTQILKVSC